MDLRYNPPKAYLPKPYSKTHPLKTYPTKPDQKSDPEKHTPRIFALKSYPEKRTRQNLTLKHYPEKRTSRNLTKKAILKNIPHESLPPKAIPQKRTRQNLTLKHYPEKRSHQTLTPKRISPKHTSRNLDKEGNRRVRAPELFREFRAASIFAHPTLGRGDLSVVCGVPEMSRGLRTEAREGCLTRRSGPCDA